MSNGQNLDWVIDKAQCLELIDQLVKKLVETNTLRLLDLGRYSAQRLLNCAACISGALW